VYALSANKSVEALLKQCVQYRPRFAVMQDPQSALLLTKRLSEENCLVEVLSGQDGLKQVASDSEVDVVMAAIVGAAGLPSALAAAQAGKRVLLANKEALVMSGRLFMQAVQDNGATLLPIDSEHNAIFQCLPAGYSKGLESVGVEKILLTASGGPFRGQNQGALSAVTPAQAVAHPNWSMGQKISVDSATLMNKGLELIEACWLFDTTPENIQVVVHPQSVIHSMVQYSDGSVLAQMGNPDMRTPIAYGLAWPERIDAGVKHLNLFDIARLDFEQPDTKNFPCLNLAAEAFNRGGTAMTVLNAANEIAVEAFLMERITFLAIPELIEKVLNKHTVQIADSMERILDADQWARKETEALIK
jgi:1-deoxy-D-xylulose-5-phosphate reductoisomerase